MLFEFRKTREPFNSRCETVTLEVIMNPKAMKSAIDGYEENMKLHGGQATSIGLLAAALLSEYMDMSASHTRTVEMETAIAEVERSAMRAIWETAKAGESKAKSLAGYADNL